LAVFAVLPSVSGKPKGKANILFFGVFTQLDETEFADRVLEELHDDERVFRLMLRDIHQNGRVLQAKKYRYLGLAYRTFLVGLTVTFLSFLVVAYLGWKTV
jgi:L-fucose isomerase-like protein